MQRCTYCNRSFPEHELKSLPLDDSPHLNRKYCPRCFPGVEKDHFSLPWIKEKFIRRDH